MSGCCGPSPVITSLPPVPRVDVEGSLLCDVLPDGTIAGQALVEAVYDTSSGERVGTRTVDPATGADYAVQGTLQPCPPPEQCSCETVLLCHTPPGTPIPGPDTSPLPLTGTGQPTTHVISGAPRQGDVADATAIWAGQTVSIPGSAAGASDVGAHTHYTVALAPGTPDCGTLDPAGDVEITATVTYTNDGPGGGWDWYGRLSLWVEGDAAPVAADNFGQGSAAYFLAGQTRTATITGTVPVAALQAGDVSVEFDLETGPNPNDGTTEGGQPKTWTVTGATLTATAAVTGCTLGTEPAAAVPFLRHICRTCAGTATVTDTTLDGATTYDASTGTVGLCGQESAGRQVIERCGCDQTASGIVRYIELWSVDTADPDQEPLLLGTWQDGDFTQPYEPVNPIDCPDTGPEEVAAPIVLGQICYDDGTGTVRTAAVVRCAGCDDTTVRYVDVETGAEVTTPTVVPCPADPGCASPTTPVTSVGLCLADGTPIAVTITRDCTGATVSEGWLNLTTGAWSAGAVPAGTVACGDSRSIQVSGTFCAVDAAEDVVALVLVEYTYDDTGAISAVRLVDATTGATYVPPVGVTVTVCPTGTAQPEQDVTVLCHTAADGTTVTQFVRDYRRDETGTITGHSDYLLDGTAYTPDPTGTVGVCQPDTCTDCETLLLCDVPNTAPVRITGTAASGTLSNGVGWTSTNPANATYAPQRNNADGSWWGMPSFPLATTSPTKWTFSRPSFVEFSVYVAYNATAPALNMAQLPPGLEPVSLPTGYAYDPATGVLTRTSDGTPPDPCSYTTDPQVIGSARFRTPSAVTSFTTAPAPNSRIARCGQFFTYWAGAVSVTPGGQFLRHICRSCDGTPTVTNTLLDGVTAYNPAGEVGQCSTDSASSTDPEACHNTTTVLLCAAPADGTTDVTPTITDSTVAAIGQTQFQNHPGPYTPLWTGGTLVYPAGPGPTQQHLAATGQLGADVAGCEDASGTLTVSVRVRNDGPDAGQAWDGALRLFRGTTQIAAHNALEWAPAGWQGTLTVSAPVTAAEVAAGDIRVSVQLETYHLGAKQWTADQFTASLELEGCALTAPVQILRNVVTDCETGQVVTTYDTTLDGEPYDVGTGEVSQCQPTTEPPEPQTCCPSVVTELLCDTAGGDVQSYPPSTVAVVPPVADASSQPISSTVAGFMINPTPLFAPGGSVVVPTWGTNPGGVRYNAIEGQVSSPGPTPCGTPTDVVITVSLRGTNTGDGTNLADPEAGMTLRNGSTVLDTQFVTATPTGFQQQYSVTATVPWADLIAGNITWYWFAKVYQANNVHKQFTLDQYEVTIEDAMPLPGCAEITPFLRHYVLDTASGTASHFDTTLDGEAYTAFAPAVCAGDPSGTTASGRQIVERCGCSDEDGDGIGEVRYVELWSVDPDGEGDPTLVGTYIDGDFTMPFTPAAPMDCPNDSGATAAPVLTGLVRVTDTNARNLSVDFPGLQSVTLTVIAGNVDVDASSFGATIPAGTSLTWSVLDGEAGPLADWSSTGQAGADYLLTWTYTA